MPVSRRCLWNLLATLPRATAEELYAHLQNLAANSPFVSDPAPEDMVRTVRSSLDKKYGKGAAEAIAWAVFRTISLEEVTKAQAMAMQNAVGGSNGRWAEAVAAILAGAGQPEEPEPVGEEAEEPEEETASVDQAHTPVPAEDGPMADPVIEAAVER